MAPVGDPYSGGLDRSWQTAVQNINGVNSILTLLPVLTGKTQNMKLLASRIYPASFVIAGVGAGRVLLKLQLGILLWSFDLYRNTIGDLSYPHDEYVNRYAPRLLHIPTGTPERHRTNMIINHNVTENYMVEAWFRTQGKPNRFKLKQNNSTRMMVGFAVYILLGACETFLAVQNAADGTNILLIAVQALCICLWLLAVIIVQVERGQGSGEIELNQLHSPEFRCLALPMSGENVASEIFSFSLNHLKNYKLYDAKYNQTALAFAGALILTSGVLDVLSTVLVVGLSTWAYSWIGFEVLIILVKVVCSVEPMREIEFDTSNQNLGRDAQPSSSLLQLPLTINLDDSLVCESVCADHSSFSVVATGVLWRSTSAGIWIGQEYRTHSPATEKQPTQSRYLAHGTGIDGGKLKLVDSRPEVETNQALQREFLAALAILLEGNKVPSTEFHHAVQLAIEGVKGTMSPEWFEFGAKDVSNSRIKPAAPNTGGGSFEECLGC